MSSFTLKRPLDDTTRATLREVSRAVDKLGIQACLIGAQARVIWLEHIHELRAARATRDTDFAVQIDDWDQFEALSSLLTAELGWRKDPRQAQRFFSAVGQMVDLVPCGAVAEEDAITWPPEHAHRMDVRGFELAMSEGVRIEVDDGCQVTIAPLHVLVLLKIVSWWDRAAGAEKDAEDLISMLRNHADAEAPELLALDAYIDLYELEDEHELRGARLVGRLISSAAQANTLELARRVLAEGIDESGPMRLVLHAAEGLSGDPDERADTADALLNALARGLNDRAQSSS